MKNYFCPQMELCDINNISMLGLAHIGDGVYELLTRTMLCSDGNKKVTELHKKSVAIVNAPAQAAAPGGAGACPRRIPAGGGDGTGGGNGKAFAAFNRR